MRIRWQEVRVDDGKWLPIYVQYKPGPNKKQTLKVSSVAK